MENTFVITEDKKILVQVSDKNCQFGFYLCDGDQAWPGGFGISNEWTAISKDDPKITKEDHDRLDWILEQEIGQ